MPLSNQTRRDVDAQAPPLELNTPHQPLARLALIKRLCDIVALPETRMPSYERQLAADVLMGLLRTANADLRSRCAQGLVRVNDAPKGLLRYLARDEYQVAQPLLEDGVGFDDSDLIATVHAGVSAHWLAISRRRKIGEAVTDALIQTGDLGVMETLLRNKGARFSTQGVDLVVALSRQAPDLAPLLVSRPEVRPNQALVMFWWVGFEVRQQIVRRFAADRAALIAELGDVFALAAAEGWADEDTRKALQVVERRQRNRAAAARSPHGSLEGAIAASEHGLDRNLIKDIAHLCGIRPATAAQILADPGGEAIGVLCKAVGLRRPMLLALWRALRRPDGDAASPNNPLGRAVYIFDVLATAKAQTVLRYWNWSFNADASALERLAGDELGEDMSEVQRHAALLFNRNG
jgi:uncharacterized protein (DUF2336 family)